MQLYWGLKSIPELAGLPSAERGRVWRAAYRQTFRHWQTWAALAGLGLCVAVGGVLGFLVDPSIISQSIGNLIGGGLGSLVFGQVAVEMARPYLRASSPLQQPDSESHP